MANPYPFSYYPPTISSISPSVTYNGTLLEIRGAQFGITSTVINVFLNPSSTLVDQNCRNLTRVDTSLISCTIPETLPAGNYSITVAIGNQNSTQVVAMNLLPPVITSLTSSLGLLNGPVMGNTPISLVVQDLFEFASVNFEYSVNPLNLVSVPAANCLQTLPNTLECFAPQVPFPAAYNITITVGNLTGPVFSSQFVYDRAQVTDISPTNGTTSGNTPFTITGINFGKGMIVPLVVKIGVYACKNCVRVNDSLIQCSTGPVKDH